jgi:hypothetical protein
MNKVLTSFTLLLLTASAQASENGVARLDVGQGVLLNGKPVKVSQVLQAGELQTDTSHPAEITLLASLAKISLRPGTRLSIAAPEATTGREIETLGAGTVRAHVVHRPTRTFYIRTKSAVMGVRGTDFMTIANPILGETEIVVFEGSVDFQSESLPSDHKLVTQGHWGGVGGRFGQHIGDLIALPKTALDYFDHIWVTF